MAQRAISVSAGSDDAQLPAISTRRPACISVGNKMEHLSKDGIK
jgi:hypothetical protein